MTAEATVRDMHADSMDAAITRENHKNHKNRQCGRILFSQLRITGFLFYKTFCTNQKNAGMVAKESIVLKHTVFTDST